MNSVRPDEDARYSLYRWGAHVAWWGALAWTTALTYVNLTTPSTQVPGAFQRVSGIIIVMLIGIGIACGSALSRMRLAKTITEVFEVGMRLANARHDEIEDRLDEKEAKK